MKAKVCCYLWCRAILGETLLLCVPFLFFSKTPIVPGIFMMLSVFLSLWQIIQGGTPARSLSAWKIHPRAQLSKQTITRSLAHGGQHAAIRKNLRVQRPPPRLAMEQNARAQLFWKNHPSSVCLSATTRDGNMRAALFCRRMTHFPFVSLLAEVLPLRGP